MIELLTTQQAATLLNLKVAWVRRLCQQGRIQAHKFGRDWQIPADEIERYQNERRKPGRPTTPKPDPPQ